MEAGSAISGRKTRCVNRKHILSLLARKKRMLRAEICSDTGLSGAAVSRISRELIDAGLVMEHKTVVKSSCPGRRSTYLSLNPAGAHVLAVSIAANRQSVAIFNSQRECMVELPVDTGLSQPPAEVLKGLIDTSHRALAVTDIPRNRLAAIGICVGALSTDNLSIEGHVSSRSLGWQNVSVATQFAEAFALPVAIEARASALLRAEAGSPVCAQDERLFLINVGLGVGSAAGLRQQVAGSDISTLGDVSHLTHPESSVPCSCGRTGCIEYSASGVSVVCELSDGAVDQTTPYVELTPRLNDALRQAEQGSSRARQAFYTAGERMALGVDSVQALVNPDRIFLAGSTGRQVDFVAGVRAGLLARRSPLSRSQLVISAASSVEAAACTALDAFVFSDTLGLAAGAVYENRCNAMMIRAGT